jgi:transcription elongation factor GreA
MVKPSNCAFLIGNHLGDHLNMQPHMPLTQQTQQEFRNFLNQQDWEAAQALWLDLAEQASDQPELLLTLVKEFADAAPTGPAAELASLLAPTLKEAGKLHEWLYTLKLQAHANPSDKTLRADLIEAYTQIYQADARLKSILNIAELTEPRSALVPAIAKADTLLSLPVGAFCQHKSWGFGRVKQFDIALNRIVVAFPHNPEHAFQIAYAAESLTPVPADHIEVRKATHLDELKQLAANEPLTLLRAVLASYDRSLTADRIETILAGSVVAPADWKKWWDNSKKLAKKDPHFDVPAKKTDPILLRAAPVSRQDELLENFRSTPGLVNKTNVARELLKSLDEIKDPELLLQEFQDGLLEELRNTKAIRHPERLEAALTIDELRSHQHTPAETSAPLLAETLAAINDLAGVLDALSASAQKRAIQVLKATDPQRVLANINKFPAKLLEEITDLLAGNAEQIFLLVQNHTASPDLLVWLCRNVAELAWLQPLQDPVLLLAVLSAIEDGTAPERRKLRTVLFDNETLLTDLLANAETDKIRDIARQILNAPSLEELDRRSLMGRLVKVFPFVQEFLVTKTSKEQPLIVSQASYNKRRAELDDIIQKKIPQNSKEIAQARSYGDLRENFEYKAAKDTQKLLMRRRAELEILLSRSQITNFADVKTDVVSIGTTVVVTDVSTGQPHTYHILGAWDSDTTRGIISYPAALAQALFNKKAGETITANSDTGTMEYRIEHIEKTADDILRSL